MTVKEIKQIAKQRKMTQLPSKKNDLIRAIQTHEGNNACFATNYSGNCGQDGCSWKADCVKADKQK